MKKLMITAAAAALTTGAFAGVAQVYDMTINVKTTECKDAKKLLTDKCGESYRYYRTQASYKFEGKFWGCGCATIAAPIAEQYGMPRLDNGLSALEMTCEDNNNSYMFWGKKLAFHHTDFKWPLLQRVGKNGDNVEGYFEAEFFGCDDGVLVEDASLALAGAGYGTAYISECVVGEGAVAEEYNHAFNYIKSMSGSVVGIYNVADLAGMVGCVYCGELVGCTPFEFCNCVELRPTESAAYGTFTIKYNSSLAGKVMNGKYIDQAYKFPTFVTEEFECIAAGVKPDDPTVDDKVTAYYKQCVQAVNVAQQGVYTTSNAWVAATAYNTQVQGGSYKDLKEPGETLTKGKQLDEAMDALVTAYNKAIKDSGCTAFDPFTNVLYKSFHAYTNEATQRAEFSASDLCKYGAAYEDCQRELTRASMEAADAKFRYETKLITANDYKYYTEAVKAAEKALVNAKADFAKAIETYTCADKVQQAKDKAAFETYYAAFNTFWTDMTALNAEFLYNELTYEQSWQYDEKGVALTEAEIDALQEEAKQAAKDATNAYSEAQKSLSAAKTDLQQAETACLITKGSKDCQ